MNKVGFIVWLLLMSLLGLAACSVESELDRADGTNAALETAEVSTTEQTEISNDVSSSPAQAPADSAVAASQVTDLQFLEAYAEW